MRTVELRRLFDDQNEVWAMAGTTKSRLEEPVRAPKRVVERNMALLGDVMSFLLGDRHVLGTQGASWVCIGQTMLRPAQMVAIGNWLMS